VDAVGAGVVPVPAGREPVSCGWKSVIVSWGCVVGCECCGRALCCSGVRGRIAEGCSGSEVGHVCWGVLFEIVSVSGSLSSRGGEGGGGRKGRRGEGGGAAVVGSGCGRGWLGVVGVLGV
jgi:hypothetical protein